MDVHLHTKINDTVEAFRAQVHQQAESWSTIRTPSALFDFEQSLQAVLNRLQTGIVGAVLEAIHREHDFVTACQNQSRLQRGVYRDGWHDVRVHTLGGHFVHLKTPYAKLPKERRQEQREKKPRQQGTGLYPRLAPIRHCQADDPPITRGSESSPRRWSFSSRSRRAIGESGDQADRDTHVVACTRLWEHRSVATPG